MSGKNRYPVALFLSVLLAISSVQAQAPKGTPDAPKGTAPNATGSQKIPKEHSSVSQHDLALHGQDIHYTATASTLIIRNDRNIPYASVFYVAYTKNGVPANGRPVTFLYNGGPGSSTIWLHMGSFGPVRIETASPKATPPAPYRIVANQYSLLDTTDLVFIDAVGTGFSKPIGNATVKDFFGVDQDVLAFNRFIERYITVNRRWNSPKFLYGESYGATRSAALSYSLEKSGVALNGVVLMSSNLNHNEHAPGLDNDYVNNLPSYAAIAWYHGKLPGRPADLPGFLDQVRSYARGPYAEALSQGQNLGPAEEEQVAQKLFQMTGLSVQYLKEANLRVSASDFRKQLLRDNRLTLGRYDARFEGTDINAIGETPSYDPSSTGITGAFVAAFHDYLTGELKYTTDDEYKVNGRGPNFKWDWQHTPPPGTSGPGRQQVPDVAIDLGTAMRENPHLKVFSANGYFDLATPFFQTEYDISHMELNSKLQQNIRFGYYPSGHMIYLNTNALKLLKSDLVQFYSAAAPQ